MAAALRDAAVPLITAVPWKAAGRRRTVSGAVLPDGEMVSSRRADVVIALPQAEAGGPPERRAGGRMWGCPSVAAVVCACLP